MKYIADTGGGRDGGTEGAARNLQLPAAFEAARVAPASRSPGSWSFFSGMAAVSVGAPDRPGAPELEGWLFKLKRRNRLPVSAWNRRWFRANGRAERLEYFRSASAMERGAEPLGAVALADIREVIEHDAGRFQFHVVTGERSFFLRASSRADLTCWLRGLQRYRRERAAYERWAVSRRCLEEEREPHRQESPRGREASNREQQETCI